MYDDDLEQVEPFTGDSPSVAALETPFLDDADKGDEIASQSQAPDAQAKQPNVSPETTPDRDEAFKSETVVKDYKSWQRINQEVAEFTGKSVDEIKALPFDERMTMLAETRKSLTDKLDALAEYENFIGIKVDAPADRWQVGEQLSTLPEKHYDKLVDEVFRTQLPTLLETAIADPATYKDEYALIDGAFTTLLERATGRPSTELSDILTLTSGISPQQLYQILQGQGGAQAQGQQSYAQPPTAQQNAPQQSQSAMLLSNANTAHAQAQALVTAGWEETSPEVQSWLAQENNLRYAATVAAAQERGQQATAQRLAEIEGKIAKSSETEAQTTAAQIDKQYDDQATAARNGALDSVVKGRVPESDTELLKDVREAIDARAERTLKANAKALAALSDAKDWHRDKAEAKARGEFAKYLAAVNLAYREAASHILNRFVVPKANSLRAADKQKAARREIGLTGAGRPNATQPNPLNGRSMRDEDVGDAAFELYRAKTG